MPSTGRRRSNPFGVASDGFAVVTAAVAATGGTYPCHVAGLWPPCNTSTGPSPEHGYRDLTGMGCTGRLSGSVPVICAVKVPRNVKTRRNEIETNGVRNRYPEPGLAVTVA